MKFIVEGGGLFVFEISKCCQVTCCNCIHSSSKSKTFRDSNGHSLGFGTNKKVNLQDLDWILYDCGWIFLVYFLLFVAMEK